MLTLPEKVLFALVLAGAASYFAVRIATLVRLIRLGKPDPDHRSFKSGIGGALIDVFTQRKVFRKPAVGLLHICIVWGFFVFAVNTVNHFTGAFLPGFRLFGATSLSLYYASLADIFAVLIIAGVAGLAVRRYAFRPESLTPRSVESAVVFLGIGGAMAAYLLSHAAAVAMDRLDHASYYVISARLAQVFSGMGALPLTVFAHAAWWADALLHLMLVALLVIPTKHLHLVAGPINLALPATRARGQMSKMDLEDETAESFGVSKLTDFTWKQNLDLYACIECGRCQDFCPTYNTGKPLKPKHLIVDLKHHLLRDGPRLLAGGPNGAVAALPQLAGGVLDVEAVWACTTCLACVAHCPMGIEHVDKLTGLRRYLTLTEAATPEQGNVAFRNMETAGNPWGFAQAERAAWADGLDVPIMAGKREADVLYWVGCSGSYDDRTKRISRAMVRILQAAGVDFAILGAEERCTCESARRLGNEYLYQTATQEIAETLAQYRFKRILTACPHCFNTFKNEYPDFGARHEVVHHAEFIAELLRSGRIVLKSQRAARLVYHDSCYLGRYSGIYDAPRTVFAAAGYELVSAPREREHGFCCGAGGGRMWLEETAGEKINTVRARELLATDAKVIGAACPFCMTMLSDGVKSADAGQTSVIDVAEVVATLLIEAPDLTTAQASGGQPAP